MTFLELTIALLHHDPSKTFEENWLIASERAALVAQKHPFVGAKATPKSVSLQPPVEEILPPILAQIPPRPMTCSEIHKLLPPGTIVLRGLGRYLMKLWKSAHPLVRHTVISKGIRRYYLNHDLPAQP